MYSRLLVVFFFFFFFEGLYSEKTLFEKLRHCILYTVKKIIYLNFREKVMRRGQTSSLIQKKKKKKKKNVMALLYDEYSVTVIMKVRRTAHKYLISIFILYCNSREFDWNLKKICWFENFMLTSSIYPTIGYK